MASIDLRDGEPLDIAIKRFKRVVQRENILREYRQHAFFVRPAERERIKRVVAQRRRHKRPRFSSSPRRIFHRRPDLPPIAYEEIRPLGETPLSEIVEQPSEAAAVPPSEASEQLSPSNDPQPNDDTQTSAVKTA